jgi:hypothetical protein
LEKLVKNSFDEKTKMRSSANRTKEKFNEVSLVYSRYEKEKLILQEKLSILNEKSNNQDSILLSTKKELENKESSLEKQKTQCDLLEKSLKFPKSAMDKKILTEEKKISILKQENE